MRQTIINTYLQTIGKTWEQVSSYERTVLSSFADELERKLTPTKKGVQLMSKNTTDEMKHYDRIIEQFDSVHMPSKQREIIMTEIEQLITNREKLARIDELEKLNKPAWLEIDGMHHVLNRLATLCKELDGGQE